VSAGAAGNLSSLVYSPAALDPETIFLGVTS
jgi:hypothetical protein